MLALDTNILIRYLVKDHQEQSKRAKFLVDSHDSLVPATVLLEVEWVLRSIYRQSRAERCVSLRSFVGLPRVRVEDPPAMAAALDLMDAGMDFADALHLQAATGCDALMSFDRGFAKIAARLGTLPVRAP